MYPIIKAPHRSLRRPTREVNFVGPKLTKIIEEMKATLVAQKNPEGVGLAAPQIGLSYRLFIARFEIKKSAPIHVFINPSIIAHSPEAQPEDNQKLPLEGCLSVPNYYGIVRRFKNVTLKYQTINGRGEREEKEESFTDFPAVVIQHEMDHLNGKIFVERILEQGSKLYKSTGKDKKGKDIWEEVEI